MTAQGRHEAPNDGLGSSFFPGGGERAVLALPRPEEGALIRGEAQGLVIRKGRGRQETGPWYTGAGLEEPSSLLHSLSPSAKGVGVPETCRDSRGVCCET